MTAILFLLILFAMSTMSWLPFALTLSYFILSTVTFIIYGLDKLLALKEQRRFSEKTLHLFSLIGGWPGAYIGQQIFRHKISKRGFRRNFLLTAFINVFVMGSYLVLRYKQGLIVLDFTH